MYNYNEGLVDKGTNIPYDKKTEGIIDTPTNGK